MSQDVLRRLRVSVRDQATVGAAEHGVSTHVVIHVPAAGAGLRRPLLANLQQQQQVCLCVCVSDVSDVSDVSMCLCVCDCDCDRRQAAAAAAAAAAATAAAAAAAGALNAGGSNGRTTRGSESILDTLGITFPKGSGPRDWASSPSSELFSTSGTEHVDVDVPCRSMCSYHVHHDDTRTRRPWHRDEPCCLPCVCVSVCTHTAETIARRPPRNTHTLRSTADSGKTVESAHS
jgi:hypothetical protein